MNTWKDWILLDAYDVDRQEECQKGNYLVGNDQEWYRYAVHNIVDETDPLYRTEEEAWMWLYDRLCVLGLDVDVLPSYETISWWKKLII
jgi:hypothetical protein